jgi:hypothetical protein
MADLRIGGIDPDQGTAVAAGTDRHIAVYQERQAVAVLSA